MTNIGIVLPDAGWHDEVRALCTLHGAVLIIDETHTICAGPGGMIARDSLNPDAVVVGKTNWRRCPRGRLWNDRGAAAESSREHRVRRH